MEGQGCRAEEARKHVPEGFRLVSLLGWTLGGVYLARYSDSPAGAFDELVVLAGLVWNAPTSCAWAQRVYVNSHAARNHGVKHVGLPSRLACFAQATPQPGASTQAGAVCASADAPAQNGHRSTAAARESNESEAWWNVPFAPHRRVQPDTPILVANCENGKRGHDGAIAQLQLPCRPSGKGLPLRMHLPNFSGGTQEHPGLAFYKCELRARLRPLIGKCIRALGGYDSEHAEDVSHVLHGKPLLCVEFADMCMTVPEPTPLQWSAEGRKYVKLDI